MADTDRLAVVEAFFERWTAGDRTVREDEIHPEAELHTRLAAAAGEPYRGREGIERWGRDLGQMWETMELEVDQMIETDDGRVLVTSTAELSTHGSDVTFTQPIAWLFTFRDELPVRMDVYQSHAEGRKAAGLL
jgi:hypothetical protein